LGAGIGPGMGLTPFPSSIVLDEIRTQDLPIVSQYAKTRSDFRSDFRPNKRSNLLLHLLPPVVIFLLPRVAVLQAGDGGQGLGAEAAGLHEHLTRNKNRRRLTK